MQRNSDKCAHCGRIFARVTQKIPRVNRSDERSFHLELLSGPNPRPRLSGGFHSEQLMCNFVYAHDQIAPTNYVLVYSSCARGKALKRYFAKSKKQLTKLQTCSRQAKGLGRFIPLTRANSQRVFPNSVSLKSDVSIGASIPPRQLTRTYGRPTLSATTRRVTAS